jgi:hypothetical protein
MTPNEQLRVTALDHARQYAQHQEAHGIEMYDSEKVVEAADKFYEFLRKGV